MAREGRQKNHITDSQVITLYTPEMAKSRIGGHQNVHIYAIIHIFVKIHISRHETA